MKTNQNIPKLLAFVAIVTVPLGMFQFWPFTLTFLIIGGVVAGIITALTGHVVNLFLVLVVEYLLMVSTIFLVFCMQGQNEKRKTR